MSTENVLSKIVCLRLEYHLYHGRKKLRLGDLKNVSESQVPPSGLASLGSKHVFDKDELQKFNTVVKRADRFCSNKGTRFMDIFYAFSEQALREIKPELDACVAEFKQLVKDFEYRFDEIKKSWLEKNKDWSGILERETITSSEAASRFDFCYHIFQVSEFAEVFPGGLDRAKEGLSTTLFREIAELAEEVYNNSFAGKERVRVMALDRVREARDKLESLCFIDPRIGPVKRRIDASLAALPMTGTIEGNDLNAVVGLLAILSSDERMKSYGQSVLDGSAFVVDSQELPLDAPRVEQTELVLPPPKVVVPGQTRTVGFF